VLDIIGDAFRQARSDQSFDQAQSQQSQQSDQDQAPLDVATSGYAMAVDADDYERDTSANNDGNNVVKVVVEDGEEEEEDEEEVPFVRQASQSNR